MKTISELKAELKATQDAIKAEVRRASFVNEGGEGYSRHDELVAKAVETDNQIFAAEWTAEVWADRKAAWNAEIVKLGGKVNIKDVQAIEKNLGWTMRDMQRAKAIHG